MAARLKGINAVVKILLVLLASFAAVAFSYERLLMRSDEGGDGKRRHIHQNVVLSEDYDTDKQPWDADGSGRRTPLRVDFSLNLASILSIDEPNQVVSMESTVRIQWHDTRINVTLPPDHPKDMDYLLFNRDPIRDIWFPDVFIDKAKAVRAPTYKIPPAYLRMFPGGRMLYSARVNYDISCPMSFESYPVDVQVCEVSFESWGSTSQQMDFQWRKDDTMYNKNIKLNQHDFNVSFVSRINTGYSTGKNGISAPPPISFIKNTTSFFPYLPQVSTRTLL